MRISESVQLLGLPTNVVDPESEETVTALRSLGYSLHGGFWSEDGAAVLLPKLHVVAEVIRAVAQGQTLFKLFNPVNLLCGSKAGDHTVDQTSYWFAWGDLDVFETGDPTISDALFLRGPATLEALGKAHKYMVEIRKSRATASL